MVQAEELFEKHDELYWQMLRKNLEVYSFQEVMQQGVEFAGDVCFSGEFGDQVYTNEMEYGGEPVTGLVYEKYRSGELNYYTFYKDGVKDGKRVRFYESGNVKSVCEMDCGTINGVYIEWYDDGQVKAISDNKYGLVLREKVFDEEGNLTREKTGLEDYEKELYERYCNHYGK